MSVYLFFSETEAISHRANYHTGLEKFYTSIHFNKNPKLPKDLTFVADLPDIPKESEIVFGIQKNPWNPRLYSL